MYRVSPSSGLSWRYAILHVLAEGKRKTHMNGGRNKKWHTDSCFFDVLGVRMLMTETQFFGLDGCQFYFHVTERGDIAASSFCHVTENEEQLAYDGATHKGVGRKGRLVKVFSLHADFFFFYHLKFDEMRCLCRLRCLTIKRNNIPVRALTIANNSTRIYMLHVCYQKFSAIFR